MTNISKEEIRGRLGNIDQIRDLLFGDKIIEYEQRFAVQQQQIAKLQSEFSNFQLEMRDRLTQLQNSLSTEIRSAVDSLEKKLQYLNLTTHEETSKLQQQLKVAEITNNHNLESLQNTVTNKTNFLQNELNKTQSQLEEDVQSLKKEVFEQLDNAFTSLKEGKVSRTDLAEVLFEICLKMKGTDLVPALKETGDNHIDADFFVPEEESAKTT